MTEEKQIGEDSVVEETVIDSPADVPEGGKADVKSSTENKVVLSVEELEEKIKVAVKAAEKESSQKEKQKLYETIDKLKSDLKESNSYLSKFKQAEDERKKKEDELRRAEMSDDERRDEAIRKANRDLEQLNTAFEMLKRETEEKLRKKDLEIYRERLITKANGKIIPELVSGDSVEELDESFKKAVDRFNYIRGQVAEEIQNKSKNESPKTNISQETPNQTKQSLPKQEKELTAEEIRKMTPEAYAKYKEDLLNKFGV